MSLTIEEKYASIVGMQLEGFVVKQRNPYTANFRCCICGDSSKNKNKKRGFFYVYKGKILFRCHNCGSSLSLSSFLKQVDPILHKEFIFECFQYNNDYRWNSKRVATKEQNVDTVLKKLTTGVEGLRPINNLESDHKAIQYLRNRCIPEDKWKLLYYTQNYMKWVNNYICEDKFDKDKIPKLDQRIVIPFYDALGIVFAYQGRAIYETSIRYVTINESEKPLVFGLERVDRTKDLYVVEGPFDSLFLDNAVAVGGSALKKLLKVKNDNMVFVFDDEPRAEIICNLMQNIIEEGRKIVIWNSSIPGKDINEKYLYNKTDMNKILKEQTFQNLEAQLEFNKWRKI